jgi:hypothetical protein
MFTLATKSLTTRILGIVMQLSKSLTTHILGIVMQLDDIGLRSTIE